MTKSEIITEKLIKATHSLDFASRDLWDACEHCTPMQRILIMQAHESAMELLTFIAELKEAAEGESCS